MTKGIYKYDFGDSAGITPEMKMHTLGHDFIPPPIYAGGLRYHGVSPIISLLVKHGIVRPDDVPENEARQAGLLFAKAEGIVPAPESAHAIATTMRLAKEIDRKDGGTIVFNLSGHGLFDMSFYTN